MSDLRQPVAQMDVWWQLSVADVLGVREED